MILTEKSLRKAIKNIILEMRGEQVFSDDLLFPDESQPASDRQKALDDLVLKIREEVKGDPRVYVQDITEKMPMNATRPGVKPQFPFEVYEEKKLYELVANAAYKYVFNKELPEDTVNDNTKSELQRVVFGQEGKYQMSAPTLEELFDSAVASLTKD